VLYSLMLILAHGYLLVILLWSSFVDSLLFCKFWHGDEYNYSNTCLYVLLSTLMLILMHSIPFFSRFVFDEFIVKGGGYEHKVDRTLC
jgi:predicted membrane channel-forming protein YqfA (hemolysin III family)